MSDFFQSYPKVPSQIRALLRDFGPAYTEQELDEIREFLDHNEWGETLDLAVWILLKKDTEIPREFVLRCESIATEMGASEAEYMVLLRDRAKG